jgi:DNA-binding transcriptional MerR regulator
MMRQRARMKMKELERAAGVGRETIRFYIRQGLLPEPERAARNVAWYDASFIDRIALIKELQQKRFLPLHVIKTLVGTETPPSRDEVQTLLELRGKLFPPMGGAPDPRPEKLSDVAKRTGLKATEIRGLADAGVIEIETHDGDLWLAETAIRIAELWAKLRAAGFTEERGFSVSNLRLYADMVGWLAREELRLFTRGVTGQMLDPDTAVRMAEDGITYVNQIIALLRKDTLLRYIAEGNLQTPDGETPGGAASTGS